MFDRKLRINNTIAEITYSDYYDDNMELFDKGINILKKYYNNTEEFSDEDRETLEEISIIMNG